MERGDSGNDMVGKSKKSGVYEEVRKSYAKIFAVKREMHWKSKSGNRCQEIK